MQTDQRHNNKIIHQEKVNKTLTTQHIKKVIERATVAVALIPAALRRQRQVELNECERPVKDIW